MNKKHNDFSVSYNLPKILFEDNKYKTLSINAKVLYSIMLSKLAESVNNKQLDENGYYVYFPVKDISNKLMCSDPISIKTKKELLEIGLITEKRKMNEPNRIYVNQIM